MSADAGGERAGAAIGALRADPSRAAILSDIDGTLAPIVERPEQVSVPEAARSALEAVSESFRLVGCISGRPALAARKLVGIDRISYAGNHGLELLLPGEESPQLDPALQGRERAAARFVESLEVGDDAGIGLRWEDKGPIQALHWRGVMNEEGAEARAREIAAMAEAAGLHPHWGRKVLELRPLAGAGKDAAVAALLGADGVSAALYAGDDRTDLDAFRRLRELQEGGELETAICVGVTSPEGPVELAQQSDVCVEGPAGWLRMLESLAG